MSDQWYTSADELMAQRPDAPPKPEPRQADDEIARLRAEVNEARAAWAAHRMAEARIDQLRAENATLRQLLRAKEAEYEQLRRRADMPWLNEA